MMETLEVRWGLGFVCAKVSAKLERPRAAGMEGCDEDSKLLLSQGRGITSPHRQSIRCALLFYPDKKNN